MGKNPRISLRSFHVLACTCIVGFEEWSGKLVSASPLMEM
jgi:hypothetical protein